MEEVYVSFWFSPKYLRFLPGKQPSELASRSSQSVFQLKWELGGEAEGSTEWSQADFADGAWSVKWRDEGHKVDIVRLPVAGAGKSPRKELHLTVLVAQNPQGNESRALKTVTWSLAYSAIDEMVRKTGTLALKRQGEAFANLTLAYTIRKWESDSVAVREATARDTRRAPHEVPLSPSVVGSTVSFAADTEEIKLSILQSYSDLHKLAATIRRKREDVTNLRERRSVLDTDVSRLNQEIEQQRRNKASLQRRLAEEGIASPLPGGRIVYTGTNSGAHANFAKDDAQGHADDGSCNVQ
eukprot:Hpha_TRINITY_DN22138_c0_g1::TRINITY_DN22138_c0_g1_i1::g.103715::m.103715